MEVIEYKFKKYYVENLKAIFTTSMRERVIVKRKCIS